MGSITFDKENDRLIKYTSKAFHERLRRNSSTSIRHRTSRP